MMSMSRDNAKMNVVKAVEMVRAALMYDTPLKYVDMSYQWPLSFFDKKRAYRVNALID